MLQNGTWSQSLPIELREENHRARYDGTLLVLFPPKDCGILNMWIGWHSLSIPWSSTPCKSDPKCPLCYICYHEPKGEARTILKIKMEDIMLATKRIWWTNSKHSKTSTEVPFLKQWVVVSGTLLGRNHLVILLYNRLITCRRGYGSFSPRSNPIWPVGYELVIMLVPYLDRLELQPSFHVFSPICDSLEQRWEEKDSA